jgi:hypothetical protein
MGAKNLTLRVPYRRSGKTAVPTQSMGTMQSVIYLSLTD